MKDLDDFKIELPELPDVLGEFVDEYAEPSALSACAPTGPLQRYFHNPTHFLSERAVMAAMLAAENLDAQLRAGQTPAFEPLKRVVDEVVERLTAKAGELPNGIMLRVAHQPHHRAHPVNVMIVSVATGLALGYDLDRLRTLGLAGLCHDVGKAGIGFEVLDKVGALTAHEVELLRAHPLMGKRMLETLPWGSPLLARIVHEHHERIDGSGYPQGLRGDAVHEMARIVAIAEVFDALSMDMPYRSHYSPELAYGTVLAGEAQGFDPKIVQAFSRFVFPYPQLSFVVLDTQEIGTVIANRPASPLRPLLKVGSGLLDLTTETRRQILDAHHQPY